MNNELGPEATDPIAPDVAASPSRRRSRTIVVVTRRVALGLAWGLTVALAGVGGWFGGRMASPVVDRYASRGPAVDVRPEEPAPPVPSQPATEAQPEPPAEESIPEPTPPAPAAAPAKKEPQRPSPAPKQPAPPADVESAPDPAAGEESVSAEASERSGTDLIARLQRAGELADSGDQDGARSEADALLAEYDDYSGLTDAFVSAGADEVRARLNALRVLQLAGLESITTPLARELKRSYASTPQVLEAIRDWRLLKPRIRTLDSSVERGEFVVVIGELENPDLGVVRRVLVEVEALDAAGNVLATTRTRVRPKALDPGAAGSFTVKFDKLDPALVLRTRATVIEWQSEVRESG